VTGIPFYVWDTADRFKRDVVDDFVAEYAAGRTPNPSLRCNGKIKFAAVLDRALALGFDAVCTGHYARIDPNGALNRAADAGPAMSARRACYLLRGFTPGSGVIAVPGRRSRN
jgi:tRNA-specific 2-thiouridylase